MIYGIIVTFLVFKFTGPMILDELWQMSRQNKTAKYRRYRR